jgi:SnoaL-like domain
VDRDRFQAWLDRYVDAWRTYDRGAIESLFADRAEYRYHPWDEPIVGPAAIADSWLAEPDEEGSWEASYAPFAIDADRGVATGVSRYFEEDGEALEAEYHNVFLCRFDDEGRCLEFTEVYLKRSD